MRIISGLHKNRRINFTKLKIRPTTDFAKESLFNVLQNHYNLDEVIVLDLLLLYHQQVFLSFLYFLMLIM